MMDFYNQKYVRARKHHKCEFCEKEIVPGEIYSYESGKYDGDFFVRKLCLTCFNILDSFMKDVNDDEFQWDWIQEWLSDNFCNDKCKDTCEYGFTKVQCCPIVRLKFKDLLYQEGKE